MSVLRVPVTLSIDEACAISSIVQRFESNDPIDQIDCRLALSVAAEAKSRLWNALKVMPEGDPLREASIPHAWRLDDSDIAGMEAYYES